MNLIRSLLALILLFNFSIPLSGHDLCNDHLQISSCGGHGNTGILECCSLDSPVNGQSSEYDEEQFRQDYLPELAVHDILHVFDNYHKIDFHYTLIISTPPPLDKIKLLC